MREMCHNLLIWRVHLQNNDDDDNFNKAINNRQ